MKNTLLILSVLALVSCKKGDQKTDAPKPYPVVSAETRNLMGYQTYPASIQGIVNNDVRAKIQGYITQVLVDEGQYVSQGQPLFRLETNILNETADAAKSGISAAKANYAAAQAAVNAAQVEVNRLKPLVAKNIISDIQLQTAQADLVRAQAQLHQAEAGILQANADFKGVQANIGYSVIRAPISGTVGKLPLKVGSLVGPSDPTPLTTISDTRSVYAYFSMNEKEYFDFLENSAGATVPEKIKNLPQVELQLANGSLYPEKGKIETVSGQIDATTGTMQFRVGFSNPQKLLSNGNSGVIRIPKRYDNALVVPEAATYEQQGTVYVYKVAADSVVSSPVVVEDRIDNLALITDGLKKGDQIVASGIGGLKSGAKIVPQPVKFDSIAKPLKAVFKER
ncbi:MAG: efflux RND transporter periplasmic adaptor subunit [Flavobacteriaceae bacterium]|jgi:membrane fusion protein (multidrug efflux system)|nr:efflux RND transporter periplasmic adaptor subunit [Flavobacteriaceae bacterium]